MRENEYRKTAVYAKICIDGCFFLLFKLCEALVGCFFVRLVSEMARNSVFFFPTNAVKAL